MPLTFPHLICNWSFAYCASPKWTLLLVVLFSHGPAPSGCLAMGFEPLRFDAAPGDLRFCDDGASSIIGPTVLPVLHHQSIGHGTGMCRNMLVEFAVPCVGMEVCLIRVPQKVFGAS